MKSNGMQTLGYDWIVLDDCWHPTRSADGTLVPDPDFFPDGLPPVIDYVHSLGFKFGLYTSVGDKTCHSGWSPGSYGYYDQDAQLFADWGVDWVKVDWCGDHDTAEGHKNISRAMNATGRPMVLELCRGTYMDEPGWSYAPDIAQVWRATTDHHDSFESTLEQVAALVSRPDARGAPHAWPYGDMMMTGGEGCGKESDPSSFDPDVPTHCPKQTDAEYRTEFSLYAIIPSPMMIGTDVRNMTKIMDELILNKDAVFMNQDASPPARNRSGAWYRSLSDGRLAISRPNLMNASRTVSVALCEDDADGCQASLYDVWAQKDLGVVSSPYSVEVAAHDTVLLLATPAALHAAAPGPV